MSACTAPRRGHVPGSQAQRECPVHGDRARTSPLPVPAAPIAPAPESASEHKQTVRPDGAVIEEWPDGTVFEQWYRNDKLHREDGPAWIEHRPDGTVIEEWYKDGELHREDGPAWVEHRPDGTALEWWYKGSVLHREDGPAYVRRSPDGTVDPEAWYLDGTEVEPWRVLRRYLMTRGVPGLSTEALKQIVKDVPWQRWNELGPDHPLVALWAAVHPTADASAD